MSKAEGYYRAWLDARALTATFDPEMVTGLATSTEYFAATERALSIVVGATAGNIVTIAAPTAQITALEDGTRDGIRIYNQTVALNGVSPLTITWS